MELDDLKLAWKELNQKLERSHALALNEFRERKLGHVRSNLHLLVLGQIIQLLVGIALALVGANFWVEHRSLLHLVIDGLFVHAYGIMMIVFAARDLDLIRRIDYAAPVVAIQKQLVLLRAWHLHAAVWFGFASSFIWVPLLLILFRHLGADVWIHSPQFVYWLWASGAVSALLTGLFVLWPAQSRLGRALRESSAGYSVRRAKAVLDEIESFERE